MPPSVLVEARSAAADESPATTDPTDPTDPTDASIRRSSSSSPSPSPHQRGRALDRLADRLEGGPVRIILIAGLLLSMVVAMLLTAAKDSPTVDEPIHFGAAVELSHHDLNWNPDHPVLARALAAIPLHFTSLPSYDRTAHHWTGPCCTQDQDHGLDLLYRNGMRAAQHRLFLARLMSIALTVIAVLCIAHLAGLAFGRRASLAALALAATSPTLLAHGHLLTTDISVTTFTLLGMIAALRAASGRRPWLWIVACGACGGLAMASKYTGLVTLPALGGLAAWALWTRRRGAADAGTTGHPGRRRDRLRTTIQVMSAVVASAVVTVWLAYLAVDPHLRFDRPPAITGHGVLYRLAGLLPFPKPFRLGVQTQVFLDQSGRTGFMFGMRYPGGSPLYYPAMLLVKTPLLGLALVVICLHYRRRWPKAARWMSIVPVFQLLFSMKSSTNIGVRHILLFVVYMAIIGGGAVTFLDRGRAAIATLAIVASGLFVTWTTYPSFIPYANAAFGGTPNAYRVAADSNVDWGQDLWRLADYVKTNLPHEQIWMGYFGWAPIEAYLPNAKWAKVDATGLHGVLALSASIRTVVEPTSYNSLIKGKKPFANIGGSIFLYRI